MIPIVKPYIPPAHIMMPELEKVLYSGYIAEGEVVKQFESRFGAYIANPHALSLNSGTAALHIALILAGVKEGDEVISTPLTAEPTNVAIYQAGAKVVWADIDYNTGILLASEVEKKITPKTKAIMLVHYAGIVGDMDSFKTLSEKYNVPIIEDAAHALGAKYGGTYVGNISPYTVFSFQAIKHMTTIDGGMLTVKNQKEHDRGRLMRWFGLDKTKPRLENDIQEVGYKYHMNNVNAIVGLVQMDFLDEVVGTYIDNGKYFDKELQNTEGVELIQYYEKSEPSYWLYTMKVERRNDFVKLLNKNGITASELHLRNDRHSLFKDAKTILPNFEQFYSKMVHIPCGWWVDKELREKIVYVINQGW